MDIVQQYDDVFRGIGKLKLNVDTNAEGVVQKQRRISIPLKDKCDELLNKWEELDIIEEKRPQSGAEGNTHTKLDGESIKALGTVWT